MESDGGLITKESPAACAASSPASQFVLQL